MLILGARDVRRALDDREQEVLAAVRDAYVRHARGDSAVPHSVFLRFPDDERNRIIGLPAYLGGEQPVAGMKWISSFPGNLALGLERASAALILNSMRTGHPEALIEASLVSARRTAASAALAAAALPGDRPDTGAGLIGCGVINFEVLRFLRVVLPDLDTVTLYDRDRARAEEFAGRCAREQPGLKTSVVDRPEDALAAHPLVALATTAGTPHLDTAPCRPGTLVLHVSLRDLTVESVLSAVNVVDDPDHVCRAATSLHLAEQRTGDREFIIDTIGGLLSAGGPHRRDPRRTTVFSPFGLGILDLAVADLVRRRAEAEDLGTRLTDFLPGGAP
ncbi:2,3-diaminopropionate biosynthesis protein SbnB [Kitasatospora sp. NPDC059577]|uniref:2,3-diaminopropionate biosynthesis protein SbnB n=1 Tax=Kitasatospora sp. NPDC059577 TaxID=3346873 RepID=UPI00367A9266